MGKLFVLCETAAGFVVYKVKEWDAIAEDVQSVQDAVADASRFKQLVSVVAFHAFQSSEEALENMQGVVSGKPTQLLLNFLEQNLPEKKKKWQLGVLEPTLAKALSEAGYPTTIDSSLLEITRGFKMHIAKLVPGLTAESLERFQVGLGHSFSRDKICFDPQRQDRPIQQAISLIDTLEKDVNLFAMRVKEWYSWHFPELARIVTDNIAFARAAKVIGVRDDFDRTGKRDELVAAVGGSEEVADDIIAALDISMGQDICAADMVNIDLFAMQVCKLADERAALTGYLSSKLSTVAPNLQCVVGDPLAARLISHAGSLVGLAKYPASTIQILGAEKALFHALKTKGNTPKYGLLFQSSFIGRAAQKNKGRISRYLANKCAIASRIDSFSTNRSSVFGEMLRDQVESRLEFLTSGIVPKKNLEVMREAAEKISVTEKSKLKDKKKKKSKKEGAVIR